MNDALEYYQENRGEIRSKQREYYQENEDQIRGQQVEYYRENRDQISSQKGEYYRVNQDEVRVKQGQANRESILCSNYNENSYRDDIKKGPTLICISCDRLFFDYSVSMLSLEEMYFRISMYFVSHGNIW